MPIRMTEDNDSNGGYSGNQDGKNPGRGGRGGGGGFSGGGFIGLLLPLLMRNPKLLIVVILIGGAFFLFKGGCSGLGGGADHAEPASKSAYSRGATLDEAVYDKNEVYAALENGEALPERVSLERFTPLAKDQGQQGSCVGWGSTYYGRSILEAIASGKDPNQVAFSPAFTYNQIGLENCQGTYITDAVKLLTNTGSVPYSDFPYDENSCEKKPDTYQLQDAAKYKMRGANRLSINGDDYTVDVNAIRQNLAHNAPVIIGMSVGGSFMQDMEGKDVWVPRESDFNKNGFGGHCMCVIGYDDKAFKNDGAFLIQNSWGSRWGKNGKAWVSYKDFVFFTNEAYGLDAMPDKANQTKLQCSIALMDKETRQDIPLSSINATTYKVNNPLRIGQKFKMKITNTIDCFVYIFGKESDNGSYVLFPYTAKHSAYCGITGTRVFPRDYSMEPDKIGNKDYLAVLVCKNKIDYKTFNEKLNADKQTNFEQRVLNLCASDRITDVTFGSGTGISFTAETQEKNIVPFIIEVSKN